MQNQDSITNLTFSWGDLGDQSIFLPRVTHKNLILSLATWNLPRTAWELLLKTKEEILNQTIKEFKANWKLPQHIVLADGDNELFIDFENNLTVSAFLQTIKNRESIILKEFLFDPDTPIQDKDGKRYVNQFIASVIRNDESIVTSHTEISRSTIERDFIPGSEWLFYKYYCGIKSSDAVLVKLIRPLVRKLYKEKLIDSWFFVRYKDSHSHLRVRFHLTNPAHTGKIILYHNAYLKKYKKHFTAWKIQTDTYARELERYGHEMITHSENIFFHDSEAVMHFIHAIQGSTYPEEIRWLWGIRNIDALLNSFHFTVLEKCKLMRALKDDFAAEFSLEKSSKLQLDKKYRHYKPAIDSILQVANEEYALLVAIIAKKSKHIAPVVNALKADCVLKNHAVEEIIKSHIHMHLNRLLTHAQRFQEMIIYDFMSRYYESKKVRLKC